MKEIMKTIEENIVVGEQRNERFSSNHRENELYRNLVQSAGTVEELDEAIRMVLTDVCFIATFAYGEVNQDVLDLFSSSELDEFVKLRKDVGKLYKKLLKKFKSMHTRHNDRVAKLVKAEPAKPVKEVKPEPAKPVKEVKPEPAKPVKEVKAEPAKPVKEVKVEATKPLLVETIKIPELNNVGIQIPSKIGMKIRGRNYKFIGIKTKSSNVDVSYNTMLNAMVLQWLDNNEVKYLKKSRIKKMYYNDLVQTDLLLETKIFKRVNKLALRNNIPVGMVVNYIIDDIRHQYEANR